jgi:hypothetical protein
MDGKTDYVDNRFVPSSVIPFGVVGQLYDVDLDSKQTNQSKEHNRSVLKKLLGCPGGRMGLAFFNTATVCAQTYGMAYRLAVDSTEERNASKERKEGRNLRIVFDRVLHCIVMGGSTGFVLLCSLVFTAFPFYSEMTEARAVVVPRFPYSLISNTKSGW